MAKIILEILAPAETAPRFITVTSSCVTIGRGMNNDIIIPDPYLNPEHLILDFTSEEWFCQDSGSLNGTLLACGCSRETCAQRINGRTPLFSGYTLTAGHTTIRVWDSLHPVPPAEPLREDHDNARNKTHSLLPGLLTTVLLYYILFFYLFCLGNPKINTPYMEFLSIITLMLAALALWSGFWALITRFTRREHSFARHFLFACRITILSVMAGLILRLAGFYLCSYMANMILHIVAAGSAAIFTLCHHMRLATRLPSRKRLLVASLIIIPLLGVIVMINISQRIEFSPEPGHNLQTLFLPKAFIPADPLNTTLERMNSIF